MKHKFHYKVYLYEGHKLLFETTNRTSAYKWKNNKTYIYRTDLLRPGTQGTYIL